MDQNSRSAKRSPRDPDAIAFARDQRQQANEFANLVWEMVRNRRCRAQKFRREYPIPPYTADFCCVVLKLIIEIDGEDHFTESGRQRDQSRDHFLAERGYCVLRIPGFQLLHDPTAVRLAIESEVDQCLARLGPLVPDPS